jgi:hypothetical protein
MDTNFASTNTTSNVYTGEAATTPLRGAGSHGRSDLPHAPGKSFSTGGSQWPKGVLTYRPHKTTPEEHERRVRRIKEIQAEHGIFIEAPVTSSASRSGGPSWQEWARQAASDTAASAWQLLERGANALMPQMVAGPSTSQDAGTCRADASQCTPSPPPATADARTTAFNSFLQKHKLRALTPDLVPLELTSLDGKLVIFSDKHDEVEMHKGLASFFKAHLRPNDSVLGETVNTCELAERCRIIDDPDAQEALVKAIGSLLKAAKHALAELEQAKVGGNDGLKFWKDTAKLLANPDGNAAADLMKLGRQMARALPNWRTDKSLPDKVRKALITDQVRRIGPRLRQGRFRDHEPAGPAHDRGNEIGTARGRSGKHRLQHHRRGACRARTQGVRKRSCRRADRAEQSRRLHPRTGPAGEFRGCVAYLFLRARGEVHGPPQAGGRHRLG